MRLLIILLIVGALGYFGYTYVADKGLLGGSTEYPFGRTLTSADGRQLEVLILGKNGDTIFVQRLSDEKEFQIDRSRLAEADAAFVGGLPDGGTETTPPDAADLVWYDHYSDAINVAKKRDIPILLLYDGSPWCPASKELTGSVLQHREFASFVLNQFVLLRAPVTQVRTPGHTTQLRRRFPFQNTPTTVIIGTDETEIDRIVGSNTREFYIGKLRAIMNKM